MSDDEKHLTRDEQKTLQRALRRSVKVVTDPSRPAVEGDDEVTALNKIAEYFEAKVADGEFIASNAFKAKELRRIAARIATLSAQLAEEQRQKKGYMHHLRLCEQEAGQALDYPWFKDDQKNFPGATEADGVCIGEHVGDTIVAELANKYRALAAIKEQE